MVLQRFPLVPLFASSLLLFGAGCGHDAVPPEGPTSITSGGAGAAPRPTSQVGPSGLGVSDAITRACDVRFDNADGAPKFAFDDASLSPADRGILDQIATCVTTGPLAGRPLALVGRADPRGEAEYNMALGERRADAVRSYLAAEGVPAARLDVTSRGELDASGSDEAGWQRDRRVDLDLR